MQLNKKQEMYTALGFGTLLILVGILLLTLFAGRSVFTCTRENSKQGECIYKVQSVFNNQQKTFKLSDLIGAEAHSQTSRSRSSSGGLSTNWVIQLNTTSEHNTFKMDYGIHKNVTAVDPEIARINAFVSDTNLKGLTVTQQSLGIISIISSILVILGGLLNLFALITLKKMT
jgi:hypothetical protein